MIVVSPSVQLSFVEPTDANRGVIGHHNLVTISNIVATSEDPNYLARNLANPATYLRWQSLVMTEQFLTVTLTGEQEVDYVGLARHNFGSGQIPISVEAFDGANWVEVLSDFIPPNDGALLLRFDPGFYEGVRLRIQSSAVLPRCSVMNVGKLLVLQRNIYVGHTPITMGREDRVINGRSESGEFLGRIVLAESLESSISLQNLTASWYRSVLDPFIRESKEKTFFYAWRPASYPLETAYGWVTNNPRPVNERSNGMMSVQIDLGAVA